VKLKLLIFPLLAALLLCSCVGVGDISPGGDQGMYITDSLGNTAFVKKDARVICGSASLSQCWLLAGGSCAAVTEDVWDRGLDVPGDTPVIGTVKSLDLEKIIAAEPDYVLLSADLSQHLSLSESLADMGVAHGYFREDGFEQYREIMTALCGLTGRNDLYEKNVAAVEEHILEITGLIPENGRSCLLLRGYSTGMKAKGREVVAGRILAELGAKNLGDLYPVLTEELSTELIVQADPHSIFVVTMGDEKAALAYAEDIFQNDPVWSGLTAVTEGRVYFLPQELFHHKPNDRWDESYEYMAKILYPEIFEKTAAP